MEHGIRVADDEVTEGAPRNKGIGVSGNKGHEKVKAAKREGPETPTLCSAMYTALRRYLLLMSLAIPQICVKTTR
ncbi:hypothetical protein E2C01_081852 [Portunus trituberculatus]|uniref:Uncharacterized protein n=1 Tax=Portunus trituberculatus TaxID=210409 RepID=A0A5B7J3E6_PORTR|nr:hypothetical protein [Portunus trituberculatus]